MPFMRLDGYWVLADLTGVPDFISHIGGIRPLARALDDARHKATPPVACRRLKRWASVVFVAVHLVLGAAAWRCR